MVLERLDRIESVLHQFVERRTVKEWYSPVEVAEILGKKPYTVREWCRLRRINAPRGSPAGAMLTSGKSRTRNWNASRTTAYFPFPPNTESIAFCCWSGNRCR